MPNKSNKKNVSESKTYNSLVKSTDKKISLFDYVYKCGNEFD